MKAKYYYPSFEALPVFAGYINGKIEWMTFNSASVVKTSISPFTIGVIEILGFANNNNEAVLYSVEHKKTFCVHAADFYRFWKPFFININKIWNNLNN